LRVLMIAPEPFLEKRGTPISVLCRVRAMQRLGYQVELLTYHLGEEPERNVRLFRIPRVPFIRRVRIGPCPAKVPLDFLLLLRAFSLLRAREYHCIHTHEEAAIIGAFLKGAFHLPHIYDMHSSLTEQLVNYDFVRWKPALKIARRVEKWILRHSDVVIVICPYLEKLVESIVPGTKTVLIENVSPRPDVRAPSAPFAGEGMPLGERVALYVGNFGPNQGLDLLLKSIPRVVQKEGRVRFRLVGGLPAEVKKLKRLAERLGVGEYVLFAERKSDAEVARFIEQSAVLLSPRKIGNNIPSKIYLYLKSGRPIVATRLPAHTQILNDDTAVLTDLNPKAFADGILRVLRDGSLAQQIARNALALTEAKYTYSTYLRQVERACRMAQCARVGE